MKVVADSIDKTHIKFTCPHCFSKYKKNGEPYKRAKNLVHTHGSNNDLSNRRETRVHHGKRYGDEVEILITDETKRL